MTTADQFNEIWERGRYRQGSTAQRLVPFLKTVIPEGSVVNDYGSGTGRAEKDLLPWCKEIHMVDFADAALEADVRILIGDKLTYTIADLADLPEDFPAADWGICINVLMTVDPDRLDAILSEIRRTCGNLICEVYDMADHRLGRDLTTIKQDGAWWAEKLNDFWPHTEAVTSPEHRRRYITICRSEIHGETV